MLVYTGVDVDRRQIDWAARHLPGRFEVIPTAPPTALASGSFDLIFTISVFTHLDESMQEAWLAELARLLRPGGLLLATTHSPEIARTSPGVTPAELTRLAQRGFLFRPSVGPFNEQSAFHSEAYLRESWSRQLRRRAASSPSPSAAFRTFRPGRRPERPRTMGASSAGTFSPSSGLFPGVVPGIAWCDAAPSCWRLP